MAKWPNHFIFGKPFRKRINLDDLALKKGQMAAVLKWKKGVREREE